MAKMILGLANVGLDAYGGRVNKIRGESKATFIRDAIQRGFNYFDAAESYGDIHKWLSTVGSNFSIDTKISNDLSMTKTDFDSRIGNLKEDFGEKLRTVYFHNASGEYLVKQYFDDLIGSRENSETKIGVSIYDKEDLHFFAQFAAVKVVQVPASVLDISNVILAKQLRPDWRVVVRSIFLRGRLFQGDVRVSSETDLDKASQFSTDRSSLLVNYGPNLEHLSIIYFLQQPRVDSFIVSSGRLSRLDHWSSLKHQSVHREIIELDNEFEKPYTNVRNWI